MKLTYRGIQYNEENQKIATSTVVNNQDIIYRGNSPQAKINPKFPWLRYIKQLLRISENKPVFDPITFWYNHKRQFLEDLWCADNLKHLHISWNLTLQIEQTKALKAKQKSGANPMSFTHLGNAHQDKLKYRGVTYYK